jgi:hypothetical protein
MHQFKHFRMPRIDKLSYRNAAKAQISARLKQLMILVLTVIIGMLISVTVNAQHTFQQQKANFYQDKYKSQIQDYSNACAILKKKEQVPADGNQ